MISNGEIQIVNVENEIEAVFDCSWSEEVEKLVIILLRIIV